MGLVYKVCIPNTMRNWYDYTAENLSPKIGARVVVPFHRKNRIGVVVAEGIAETARHKIKSITECLDEDPLIPKALLELCQWVSTYYQSPLSEVLSLAVPKKYRDGEALKITRVKQYSLAMAPEVATKLLSVRAKRQHELLDFFKIHPHPVSHKTLMAAGFKPDLVKSLLYQNIVAMEEVAPTHFLIPRVREAALPLNSEQDLAVSTISTQLHQYQCFLLQGVTGSGKTEVYLQVIAKVLAQDRQVLVLVPEIGLTPQLVDRFQQRFHESIVVLHSHLSDNARQSAWHAALHGEAAIVIGTRTAVFTPMPDLGLIVVDEEHDGSFKQMDGVRYSARDTALMRAHLHQIPIILGSATPSLESLHNVLLQKYQLLKLTQKALSTTPLHYQIVDIRNQSLQHGLADTTLAVMQTHLNQGNQVLVFINRRGFAPVLMCHLCGWMADCRACDSHATIHRRLGKLICHHCGLMTPIPLQCGGCQGTSLLPIGAGTQRIHEFLSAHFPNINQARIDRDEVNKKDVFEAHLDNIHRGDTQLIVGTQMLAKGHHFPKLTLVVILDADNGFYNQDFRALERLGQLLTQVAGRAGRAEHPGQVLIQTHLPQHPLLNLLIQEGYDAFANALLPVRQIAQFPPYHFLAVIRAQGRKLPNILQFLHQTKTKLAEDAIQVLGPAPAPLARKAGLHRMQLLLKSNSRKKLQAALTRLRISPTMGNGTQGVQWNVDVDPMDLS